MFIIPVLANEIIMDIILESSQTLFVIFSPAIVIVLSDNYSTQDIAIILPAGKLIVFAPRGFLGYDIGAAVVATVGAAVGAAVVAAVGAAVAADCREVSPGLSADCRSVSSGLSAISRRVSPELLEDADLLPEISSRAVSSGLLLSGKDLSFSLNLSSVLLID